MNITLQESPLIIAEIRVSPETPAIVKFVSGFLKKSINKYPGGTFGNIKVIVKSDRKDARNTNKPNIFSRFGID